MLQLESFVVSIAEFFLIDRENEPNFDNNRKNYVIPKYQREYTWTTEKVQTLISDINNRDKFLGNIILNKVPNYYEIVDGQQRITTIFLILIALFNQNRLPNSKALSAEQHDILRYLYLERSDNQFLSPLRKPSQQCLDSLPEVYQNQSFYLHLSSLHCLFLSFHKYLSLLYKIYNIHTAYRR